MSLCKSVAYRCMKCRGRNTMPRPVEQYKRVKKCRHCGHTRFYIDKARQNRTDICRDEACKHYPHRYKSSICIHHPEHELLVRVGRHGEDATDVRIEMSLRDAPPPQKKKKETDEVPF